MVLVTEPIQQAWMADGFAQTVAQYVASLSSPTQISAIASACKDSKGSTLTYAQVAWALAFLRNNLIGSVVALPESDTELAFASELAAWR